MSSNYIKHKLIPAAHYSGRKALSLKMGDRVTFLVPIT